MTHEPHHRIQVTEVDTMNSLHSPEEASQTMRIPTLKVMIINTLLHQTIHDLHQATIKAMVEQIDLRLNIFMIKFVK